MPRKGKDDDYRKILPLDVCYSIRCKRTNISYVLDTVSRMTTWKHCERMVAKLLGGERTGCNGESRRDVEHDRWSIEVKHRKTLPKWLHSDMKQAEIEAEHRVPIVVLHVKNLTYEKSYVIIRIDDFVYETEENGFPIPEGKEGTD